MIVMNNIKYLILIMLLNATCKGPAPNLQVSPQTIIFSNVNVVDVLSGAILPNQVVTIEKGKITNVIPFSNQSFPDNEVIDGTDKYLSPGLTEMHAHIPSPQWGRDNTDETLFLYLSNGVTTIRGMLGHPIHLELREKAENNEILSPRIFTSSPSINGNSVQTIEEARTKVTQYKSDGYDFLKLHPGLKLEVFDEVVKTAKEVGIKYSGHVSVDVGIRHALNNNYASIDHVDGFVEGLVPETMGVDPSSNGFFGYNFTDLVDTILMEELIQSTVNNEVWVVPTQSLFDRWFSPESADDLASEREMKYMPKSTLDQWVNSKKSLTTNPDYTSEKWEKFNDIRRKLIKELNDNGHGLLLGSDAPQVFNVPGFSIHHELKGMLDAGLTNHEALRIGTLHPALFFEMKGEFGEIVEGASADMILLENNPLEDISNLKNPLGVMVRGKWLSRSSIEERLSEIAERAKNI